MSNYLTSEEPGRKTNVENALDILINSHIKLLNLVVNDKANLREFNPPKNIHSDDVINFMLVNNGHYNLVLQAHLFVLRKLVYQVFFKQYKRVELSKYFYIFEDSPMDKLHIDLRLDSITKNLSKKDIYELVEKFHIFYLNSEFRFSNGLIQNMKSKINLKGYGSVYTPDRIAYSIAKKTILNKLGKNFIIDDVRKIKILDLGCGTGRFYFAALDILKQTIREKFSIKQVDGAEVEAYLIKNNLYGIDIDKIAIDILKIKALLILDDFSIDSMKLVANNLSTKNMLVVKEKELSEDGINYQDEFPEVSRSGGFDVIISNPPYFLLKVNKKGIDNDIIAEYYRNLESRIKQEVEYFRQSKFYEHSIEGMLNYYRISVELAIKLLKPGGEMGVICPSTLFADISSTKLRKHVLLDNKLRDIMFFPESSRIFESVSQALCIFYLKKGSCTDDMRLKFFNNGDTDVFDINLNMVKTAFDKYEIPIIGSTGWSIIKKLSKFRKLRDMDFIRNKRGELDLTAHKRFITSKDTGHRLVRGNMVSDSGISKENGEYVSINDFLKEKASDYLTYDYARTRLICHQISNMEIKKRLRFAICGKNDILGNSCNYLSIIDDRLDIVGLMAYLNSYLLNWRFKITNSNNHISNYEISQLPLPSTEIIDDKGTRDLYIKDPTGLEVNIRIMMNYGLNLNEIIYILRDFHPAEEIKKVYNDIVSHDIKAIQSRIAESKRSGAANDKAHTIWRQLEKLA